MPVEEFRQVYLRLCKDHHIEPQEGVLSALAKSQKKGSNNGGYSLNLSTHNITVKTCAVLGRALATDRCFTDIKMNDCMLPEEGVRALAHGLSQNVACRKLDLKGNNIRGTATEALGRMLRQNNSLISLCLEWNAMGMVDTAFGVFCEGLGSNTRLQVLDLRNNQISHDGASDIASALRNNSTLRVLDLRWNNIGLIGGRSLLTALDYNKKVVKMELAGNNTPNDVLKSLDSAVAHNADRATVENDHLTRQHMLSKEIQDLRKSRVAEMTDVMDKMDRKEAMTRKSNQSAVAKITQLNDALQERKDQFNNVSGKLAMAESEIAISESKMSELSSLLARAKDETATANRQHQNELKRIREDKALTEAKLHKELMAVSEKNMQLENKVDELERKHKNSQEQVFDLKDRLSQAQADGKMKSGQYEDKLSYEKQRGRDTLKDMENVKNKEIERLQREAEDTEHLLKERINRLKSGRIELEEELGRMKNSVMEERLRAEEHVLQMKQKIKSEEEERVHSLEERTRMLQSSKDEMTSHASQQAHTIADLQSKNANLNIELETLKRKIDDLNQDLAGKGSETMAEVGKVKVEMNQKIQRLENERRSQSELYDSVSKLEKDLAELNSKHKLACTEKDAEITRIKELLRTREGEIKQMRDDEHQRAQLLQAAISSYVSRPTVAPPII